MNTEKHNQTQMFELYSVSSKVKVRGGVFRPGRILLGRSESCDLMVTSDSVSAIHAVMEIFPNKAVLYDMNSTNGTFVNGDRIVAKDIFPGDRFRLANVDFEYRVYQAAAALPPVLDILEPMDGKASVKVPPKAPTAPPKGKLPETQLPSIVYPLAADPKAEFSEYIFEDQNEIYPIFKYQTSRQAVEVIILFKENIFSVDYLPEGNFTYHITGIQGSIKEIEFPYLGKKDKFPFITLKKGAAPLVESLPGFESLLLSDKKKNTMNESFELAPQDILRLQNGELQIFIRSVEAPPQVAAAPILKRDPDFQKYLFFFLFLVVLAGVGFNVIEIPEDQKKEELAPERLATILYKQPLTVSKNKAVEKTEEAPKRVQTAPDKPAVEKKVVAEKQPDVKKPDVIETKVQDKKPDPGKKTAQTKEVVKQGTTPVTKTAQKAAPVAAKTAKPTPMPSASAGAPAVSQIQSKSIGHVEVYKSADFKSTVSSLVAKGGSLSNVQTKSASGGSGSSIGTATGVVGGSGSVQTADIATNQGSLVGATVGKLGESIGAEGLSAKRAIYQAGIPAETVVLGSMDPDIIRKILMDNLIHFRSCYQNELSTRGQEFSGSVKLNFTIGASGHVSQAGVDGASDLPASVKKCVVNVLRGIAFPAPQGGGVVEVKQPMNFYPKKI